MAPGYCRCIWQQWCEDNNKDCFDCWHTWEVEQQDTSNIEELRNKWEAEVNQFEAARDAHNAEVAAAAEKKAAKKKKKAAKRAANKKADKKKKTAKKADDKKAKK